MEEIAPGVYWINGGASNLYLCRDEENGLILIDAGMPKRQRDFVKQKQKVGKKKLAPTNATSTAFKARSVALPEQTLGTDKGQPVSHRQLTTGEMLT